MNETVDTLKETYGVRNDQALADIFKVSIDTIRAWKKRGLPKDFEFYKKSVVQSRTGAVNIPKLSVCASAGLGSDLESIDAFDECGTLIIDAETLKVADYKSLRAIRVDGYSMIPMLMPDSWVIFNQDGAYKGDGLYIVNWQNVLMVKLLQITSAGKLKIMSKNPDYESWEVDPDDQSVFRIVGKVIRAII